MRPDGSIERFNELEIAYNTYLKSTLGNDTRQRGWGEGSISNFWHVVDLCLKAHQTWFVRSDRNPFILFFPFARVLREGMNIYNETTKGSYVVQAVIDMPYHSPDGTSVMLRAVQISSTGAQPPEPHHRLAFDVDLYIDFRPAYTRSWHNSANYENNQDEEYGVTRDTIAYLLARREAGSVGDRPFGRHRERRERHRETIIDLDSNTAQTFRGQKYDNIVQFDCYATDSTRADSLADYFEGFMKLWTGIIEGNSVEHLWFWGRGEDVVDTKGRNNANLRPIRYLFRTEEVRVHVDYLLQGVSLAVQTATNTLLSSATGASAIEATGVTGTVRLQFNEST